MHDGWMLRVLLDARPSKPGAKPFFGESFSFAFTHVGGVSLPPGREGEGLRWVAGAGFGA